ncbi:hypothetical protein A0H81_11799 [Grifola frondosa]|uniref:Uncharacterized protein n=1 Tax=Grifola frondosa TaxID=5627 RepID=A0A1C7LVZ5_GRIFR|nr:hypothetical protein A0H81_11799 [Grifola frondosa]
MNAATRAENYCGRRNLALPYIDFGMGSGFMILMSVKVQDRARGASAVTAWPTPLLLHHLGDSESPDGVSLMLQYMPTDSRS